MENARLELFADDSKLRKEIASVRDCELLKLEIDYYYIKWSDENSLSINVDKCKIWSVSRCSSNIAYNYKIKSYIIERVSSIRDLGVLVNSSWYFRKHIRSVKSKSLQTLGFIKRITKNFSFNTYICTRL